VVKWARLMLACQIYNRAAGHILPRQILLKTAGSGQRGSCGECRIAARRPQPGAIADFINGVADVQNIETKFGTCSDPKIELLDDACIEGGIFWQGRTIWHRWRAGTQAALRDKIH
jgi:hypothetical protein